MRRVTRQLANRRLDGKTKITTALGKLKTPCVTNWALPPRRISVGSLALLLASPHEHPPSCQRADNSEITQRTTPGCGNRSRSVVVKLTFTSIAPRMPASSAVPFACSVRSQRGAKKTRPHGGVRPTLSVFTCACACTSVASLRLVLCSIFGSWVLWWCSSCGSVSSARA